MIKKAILMLVVLLLTGCTATGPLFERAPEPASKDALVYIYRIGERGMSGRDAYFYVDGHNVADLTRGGYTWFHAPAGKYLLEQKWPVDVTFGAKTLQMNVDWQPGRRYFYRLETARVAAPGMTGFEWGMSEVPGSVADSEIANSRLQQAFGMKKQDATKKSN